MRPTINSEKHYLQKSLFSVTALAIVNHIIVQSTEAPTGPSEVREGAIVKAVYVEMWLRTASTSPGSFIVTLEKRPGISGTSIMSATDIAGLHDYDNKKNILYTSQGLLNDQDADATPVLRQYIKIPKSKQRFGLNDKLVLEIFAQSLDITGCGFYTFKEYY